MQLARQTDPFEFARSFSLASVPQQVTSTAKLNLLDLTGILIGGRQTELSDIIVSHVAEEFAGRNPVPFSNVTASASGVALATGMTIDALDGHDGYNPSKGHVGCALSAGLLAMAPDTCSGQDFLEAVIIGYEIGSRLGPSLHATTSDYHTSGAWMAVAVALVGARLLGLTAEQTAHAVGIAEYHGPRSQMMRVIDHPTMLKDGSGWGAMAGVSAVKLAASGFTGAPALTLSAPEIQPWFEDLGQTWLTCRQYYKPYPVCRWAQPPVEAVLELKRLHQLESAEVVAIKIESFHEATRLATNAPTTTEQAQYSTSFPVALALSHGTIAPSDLAAQSLNDTEVRRLSLATTMVESARANAAFPDRRMARVSLTLSDSRVLQSRWYEPKWDATAPPEPADLRAKYDALAVPALGASRAAELAEAIEAFPDGSVARFRQALNEPISYPKTRSRMASSSS